MTRLATAAAILLLTAWLFADAAADRNWPQWRGPRATGVAPLANPPTEWSETKNVSWKVEIPGRGSSPAPVGNEIFLRGYRSLYRIADAPANRSIP